MTDEEIMKGLECCNSKDNSCKTCPLWKMMSAKCVEILLKNALDLIKRQNEELEKLKTSPIIAVLCPMWKAEAIKEFAEKLKERALLVEMADYEYAVLVEDIDKLIEEMTGVDNDKV